MRLFAASALTPATPSLIYYIFIELLLNQINPHHFFSITIITIPCSLHLNDSVSYLFIYFLVSDAIWGNRTFCFYPFVDANIVRIDVAICLLLSITSTALASIFHFIITILFCKSIKIYSYLWKRICDKLLLLHRAATTGAHWLQDQCSFIRSFAAKRENK